MKALGQILIGVAGGLLGAGLIWLVASPPGGRPVSLHPPPTPSPIVVHITGAVKEPGVYTLPVDSRVREAIEAAGGFTATARLEALNLATRLQDGAQVRVPAVAAQVPGVPGGGPETTETIPQPGNMVDLNTASPAELEGLPGIGPATAAKIVAYREEHGPFAVIEEIQEVSGIGPATFERLQDLITVQETP